MLTRHHGYKEISNYESIKKNKNKNKKTKQKNDIKTLYLEIIPIKIYVKMYLRCREERSPHK